MAGEAAKQCEGRLPRRPVFPLAIHSHRKQVLARTATISFLRDGDMVSESVRATHWISELFCLKALHLGWHAPCIRTLNADVRCISTICGRA